MKHRIYNFLDKKLARDIAKLKKLGFAELDTYQPYSDRTYKLGKKSYTVAVWIDRSFNEKLQVIVQIDYYHFLGMSTMLADGFICTKDNDIDELPEHVRLEYC